MIRALYTSVSGLISLEAKQDVITNNLANVNTNGFKGDNLSIKKFDDVLIQNFDKIVSGKNTRVVLGSLSLGSEIDETSTDFSAGVLQETNKSTDFAIDGHGFFAVQRNDGINQKEYYTRDGHFHINSTGYLVTDSGDSVLGKNASNGNLEPIYVGDGEVKSDNQGNLTIKGEVKYQLRTVDFLSNKDLTKIGDNLYEGKNPQDGQGVSVKQNSLEKSNVNVINEMVNMMTVMRSFETNQKVIQSLDETLGKAVNEVGSVR